jgi:chromosomal replication initiation ATPase DnaA
MNTAPNVIPMPATDSLALLRRDLEAHRLEGLALLRRVETLEGDLKASDLARMEGSLAIIKAVCMAMDVDYELLSRKTRRAEVVDARHLAIYLIKTRLDWSCKRIARLFNRDYHSITYALREAKDRLEVDHWFAEMAGKVIAELDKVKQP